ncbi:hypothetical protein E3N88_05622 [Mikania micrantha]|uniref:Uncharacterized protein n=1 Tax=Mikania micrantha TaxID=192012 RepID=A0A5N6PM64_9ASTR|nr:hypothetical protein E3N88_05622 [Mikania micrantha]
MQLKFGSQNVVVGSSVEMAKVFIKTQDAKFACRPKTAAGKYTTYNYSNIAWAPYGPYWRQARKMCVMELFSAKRLESYEYIREEETNSLLKSISKSAGEAIPLKDLLSTVSLNVISRMVLGKRYLDVSEDSVVSPDEFKKMLDELFSAERWVCEEDEAVSKKFDLFLEHVLDEHNERRTAEGEKFVAKDMVDLLLQLADDPDLDVKLERHGVKGFTQLSRYRDRMAIAEILKKPEIFQKATEELDRVIGKNRWVQEKDMPNLPYIEAIAKETMRLHPVAPMLVPRRARVDCKVAGYDILEGTRVLVSVWSIGRDPKIWNKPEQFWPERFIGKEIDVKGHDFELLPFGAGRRMCPGYSLGYKVIESTLANLLHGFKWKLPGSMTRDDLNMEENFGLSTPKKFPLQTVAEPRLPPHMYNF